MTDLVIYGAGSVGRLSEQIIHDINEDKKQFNLLGYLDDDVEKHNTFINNNIILGGMEWLEKYPDTFVGLGFSNPLQKFNLIKRLKKNGYQKYVQLIHPQTWISKRVKISTGSVICPGVHIDVDVEIGDFNLLNNLCTVGHDTRLGSFTTISPGVNIGGFNNIKNGVEFGINSCSVQYINIGSWATIGAGAVIIRDVPDNAVVVGNPGRILRIGDNTQSG